MKTRKRREHGQVIYLLAIGIISLLGFTALAIDGARLFSERRTAQGVADTAAFTAAAYLGRYTVKEIADTWYSWTGIDQRAESAALERIRSNGYTDPLYDPFYGNDRLRIEIKPYPDEDLPLHEIIKTRYFIVKVTMISEVEPIFAQLVYHGPLLVNVESHAIVMPQHNLGYGDALVSLSEEACDALQFTGGSTIEIIGSGIFSNSSCEGNQDSINMTGGTIVDIDGVVSTPGDIELNGGATLNSTGTDNTADQDMYSNVPLPDCSSLPAGKIVQDTTVIPQVNYFYPGVYNSITINSVYNKQVFLPGLFCVNNNMKITNGNVTAHNVTIFVKNGSINILGGVVDFIAPSNGEADDGTNTWDGMLFYVKEGVVDLIPDSGSYFEGTIYAPSDKIKPTCQLTGNGDTVGYNLQFVCDTIALNGTADLFIDYDGTNAYSPPVSIDLIE